MKKKRKKRERERERLVFAFTECFSMTIIKKRPKFTLTKVNSRLTQDQLS